MEVNISAVSGEDSVSNKALYLRGGSESFWVASNKSLKLGGTGTGTMTDDVDDTQRGNDVGNLGTSSTIH